VSTRRSVPTGVQAITAVGGFAAGIVTLGSALVMVQLARSGEFGLAVRFLFPLALGVGHLVSLYGLVSLERWGYRWTRRLFAVTLALVAVPAVQTRSPVQVGTLLFSAGVLAYLWLLRDSSVFTASVDAPSGDDDPVEVDTRDDDGATTIDVDPLDRGGETDRERDRGSGNHGAVDDPDPDDGDGGDDHDTDRPGADGEPDPTADGDTDGDDAN